MLAKFLSGENFDPPEMPYSSVFWKVAVMSVKRNVFSYSQSLFLLCFLGFHCKRKFTKYIMFNSEKKEAFELQPPCR
ncbi:hypothetical protein HQ45_08230 [Porphyromonas crevioricanis]|uniref:Uncharacterized protein n=2 Tax=Porphyromonas crevioricanis TaxID=393921 RepID=A0A0A2FQC2_9PORP|nr:hypothetical protein HQ45_08230 [Porphyromonas crevioricanis]GAD05077.1 hypothetical protein PORCRE_775 [Porphyromonas crevioricanis JCM 15906]GAD07586.1 hypothetical protein PORCAN_1208 [Porphyromonas crevioricanis JCM 13913]KGN93218.1 hypothetical protein HQ38_09465 [Porphyromonas crevioricanis]SJZ97641.1 hypothetical protein SAMN02745203_01467 [Porphyromonas crevioricanis]